MLYDCLLFSWISRDEEITLTNLLGILVQISNEIIALLKRCNNDEEAVDKIQQIVDENGGAELAAKTMQAYLSRALHLLSKYPETPYRKSLMSLCSFIAERDR